jgi:hypothetical protein
MNRQKDPLHLQPLTQSVDRIQYDPDPPQTPLEHSAGEGHWMKFVHGCPIAAVDRGEQRFCRQFTYRVNVSAFIDIEY